VQHVSRFINICCNFVCDLMVAPFRPFGPWAVMVGVSLVTSVAMLFVFRLVSNQEAIRRARGRVIARLLEFLLFRDDFVVSMGALGRTLRANLTYLRYMLVPFFAALIPVLLLLVQLACWFGVRPLKAEERVLVKVTFRTGVPVESISVSLSASDGLEIETAPFRLPTENEIDWRLRARDGGREWVEVTAGEHTVRKEVVVGEEMRKVSTRRGREGFWAELAHPVEAPLPAQAAIQAIELLYPEEQLRLGLSEVHWLLAFFVLTVLFGLALKGPLKVEL